MAVVTWVTIFPVIILVIMVSSPLIGSLPLVPRLAVTTLVTVPLDDMGRHAARDEAAARMAVSRPAAMTQSAPVKRSRQRGELLDPVKLLAKGLPAEHAAVDPWQPSQCGGDPR